MSEYFMPAHRLINGLKGPYSTRTSAGQSANAGVEVANLLKSGSSWLIGSTDIKYASTYNPAYHGDYMTGLMAPNKVRVNDSLAFSTEALKGYDSDKDGSVSVGEFNSSILNAQVKPGMNIMVDPNFSPKYGQTVDLNNDGKIDSGEYSAWMIYQDKAQTAGWVDANGNTIYGGSHNSVDGKVTASEAKLALSQVNANPNEVKAQLQEIYNNNKIADAQKTFKMPPKAGRGPHFPGCNNFMQMIMMLMQQMFGGFCGFGGGNDQPQYDNPINILPAYLLNGGQDPNSGLDY